MGSLLNWCLVHFPAKKKAPEGCCSTTVWWSSPPGRLAVWKLIVTYFSVNIGWSDGHPKRSIALIGCTVLLGPDQYAEHCTNRCVALLPYFARHTFVFWAELLALNTDFDDLGLFVKIIKSSAMWTNIISIWVDPKSGDRTNSSTSLSRLQWLQFRLYLCVRPSTSWCLKFISCICRSSTWLLLSYLTSWSLQLPCCLSPSQPCIYLNFPCILANDISPYGHVVHQTPKSI